MPSMDMDGAAPTRAVQTPQVKLLKETCAALREVIQQAETQHRGGKVLDKAQLKAQRWQAVVLLSALKSSVRETFVAAEQWKTRVQQRKDVVEGHQLHLQNLLYEKDHLLREIRRCRGFTTKEMDQIEFADGALAIDVSPDVHRQHLDRLTQELETRKAMMAKVKELQEKTKQMEAETQQKESFLDGLRGELDGIEASTQGLQEYMGVPVPKQIQLQHDANTQLPSPLYTLYCELEAYQTASGCAKQMNLSIVDAKELQIAQKVKPRTFPQALRAGRHLREEQAQPGRSQKRMKGPSRSPSVAGSTGPQKERGSQQLALTPMPATPENPLTNVESGEIVDPSMTPASKTPTDERDMIRVEDTDDTKSVENINDTDDEDEANVWKCHEKALLLKLSLAIDDAAEGSATEVFTLRFQYLLHAKVVTVELVQPSHLSKNTLMCLFPHDDGLHIAELSTSYRFDGGDQRELEFPLKHARCRSYHWLQWVSGLRGMMREETGTTARRPEPSIRNVMQKLIKRLVVSTQLKKFLGELAKPTLPAIHASFTRHFTADIKTVLSQWNEIKKPNQEVFALFQDADVPGAHALAQTGCRFFRAGFAHTRLAVDAIVEISPEYPVRAPRFRLLLTPTTDRSASAVENQLLDIEMEVNAHYDELTSAECSHYLLVHQLHRVCQCIDIVACPDGRLPRCFGREHRSKDRRSAMVIDPITNELRHR